MHTQLMYIHVQPVQNIQLTVLKTVKTELKLVHIESCCVGKALKLQLGIEPRPLSLTLSALPTELQTNPLFQHYHLSR